MRLENGPGRIMLKPPISLSLPSCCRASLHSLTNCGILLNAPLCVLGTSRGKTTWCFLKMQISELHPRFIELDYWVRFPDTGMFNDFPGNSLVHYSLRITSLNRNGSCLFTVKMNEDIKIIGVSRAKNRFLPLAETWYTKIFSGRMSCHTIYCQITNHP